MGKMGYTTVDVSHLVDRVETLKFEVKNGQASPRLYVVNFEAGNPSSTTPAKLEDHGDILARNMQFADRAAEVVGAGYVQKSVGANNAAALYQAMGKVPEGYFSVLLDVNILEAGQSVANVAPAYVLDGEKVVAEALPEDPEAKRIELESRLTQDTPGNEFARSLLMDRSYGPRILTLGFNTGNVAAVRDDALLGFVMNYAAEHKEGPAAYVVDKAKIDPRQGAMKLALIDVDIARRVLTHEGAEERAQEFLKAKRELRDVGFDGLEYLTSRGIKNAPDIRSIHES